MAATQTIRADVAIVGAGIVGLGLAWNLARLGVDRVVVLERDRAGSGSTGRAAGGIRCQFGTRLEIELTLAARPFFEEVLADSDFPSPFERVGYAFLAGAEQELLLRRAWETQQALGIPSVWLGASDIRAMFPYLAPDGLTAGTFCAEDGFINPWDVVSWLDRQCRALGVMLRESAPVGAIDLAGGSVCAVRCPSLVVEASAVVNAAGAWARDTARLAGSDVAVSPSPRVKILTGLHPQLPRDMPLITDLVTGAYVRSERGAALFGARPLTTVVGTRIDTGTTLLADMTRRATTRFPSLAEAGIARLVTGLYELTPDGLPLAGADPSVGGLYVVAGFNGHGIMHSPPLVQAVAERIATGRPRSLDLEPFAPDRFAQAAFSSGAVAASLL